RTAASTTTSTSAPVGGWCAGSARRRNDDVPPLPSRARRPQPPLPLALHGVRLRRMEMNTAAIEAELQFMGQLPPPVYCPTSTTVTLVVALVGFIAEFLIVWRLLR